MDRPEDAEALAEKAATAWLELIDRGDAEASWAEAATGFRGAVTCEDWAGSLAKAQGPLGRPLERTLRSSEYREELPGAPDGHYVLLTYDTHFEHKKKGTETVVPVLDDDGEWRVSGYWVR